VIRSQQINESPGAGGASGVPGALSNQPPGAASAPLQGGAPTNPAGGATPTANTGMKRDSITNFEVDKTVRHVRTGMGTVRRVSAAVVVNHRKTVSGGKTQSTALTPEEISQINALVKEAIGFQKERGDSINVVNAAFTVAAPEVLPDVPLWKQPDSVAMAKEIGKEAVLALLVLYLIVGVIRPAVQRLSTTVPPAEAAPAVADGTSAGGAPASAGANSLDNARLLARQDPKIVANVVKNWVAANE
jgi:flagellar M-ring protein FliF